MHVSICVIHKDWATRMSVAKGEHVVTNIICMQVRMIAGVALYL